MRRTALAATLLLAGCSSGGDSDYAALFTLARQSLHAARITRAEAAAVPYASMGLTVGTGGESLLVLGSVTTGDELWTSSSHVVILVRDGRIARTVGLAHDLAAVTAAAGRPLPAPFTAVAAPFTSTRLADFPDLRAYGIPLLCRATYKGAPDITILGQAIATFQVEESCTAPKLNWAFVDEFWLDQQSGRAWRSLQHIHPRQDPIETELFRAPD